MQRFNSLLENIIIKYNFEALSVSLTEVPGSIPSQGPRHTKDVIKWYQ